MAGVEPTPNMDYKDAFILAMQKEKTSLHLYAELVKVIENKAQRKAFLSLVQEEAKHKLRFEIEYDSVVLKED